MQGGALWVENEGEEKATGIKALVSVRKDRVERGAHEAETKKQGVDDDETSLNILFEFSEAVLKDLNKAATPENSQPDHPHPLNSP